ncbi:hypothetical protein IJI72_00035 [Candidatus Saccharibacteria bacterium]|nr:hypothetical protein [Candidatus Saccharibacteria bacterium]
MEFDEGFLREVGLSAMGEEEKQAFLDYAKEELEVRVGEGIAEGLTEEKIKEFQETATREEAQAWLERNRPDYEDVVKKAIEEFKGEIKRNRVAILS